MLMTPKTEILISGPERVFSRGRSYLGSLTEDIRPYAINLIVVFNQNFNFDLHVKKLVQSRFFLQRNIAKISSALPKNIVEQIIHVFISSCLDYGNFVFLCLNDTTTSRLQLVQNAAARPLTKTMRRECITPILA